MERMNKISTLNFFVKYLYGELSPSASIRCMEKIMQNRELMEEFEALAEAKAFLDSDNLESPRNSTIENILSEAHC